MKRYLAMLAFLCSAAVSASELDDANKLLENKAYPQALSLYTKLAGQGNAQAQFHLGEMYWYGEAGKVDLPLARSWFEKAAGGGSKEAAAALETMRARESRSKDIAYWTGSYDGAGLTAGQNSCPQPVIPEVSKDNAAIKDVNHSFETWSACYRAQVAKLQASAAANQVIPADIANLMNQQEFEQASAHIDQVNARVAKDIGERAGATIASYEKWKENTQTYVTEQNRVSKLESEVNNKRRNDMLRDRENIVGSSRPVSTK